MTPIKMSSFSLAIGLACALTILAGSSTITFADDNPILRTIPEHQYMHESLVSVLIGAGAKAGVPVSVEDVPENRESSLSAIRVDFDTKGSSTLKSVLDALMKKTGAFAWQQDGAAINVIALALTKDNPFDEKVAPLGFKGTRDDFVELMNQKTKLLDASLLDFGRKYSGNADAIVSFQTKETLSLRQVFNRYSAAAGLRWCAEMREPPKVADRGIFRPRRTVVSFLICESAKAKSPSESCQTLTSERRK